MSCVLAPNSADDVATWAKALWGAEPREDGVVHVTAVWRSPGGELATLAIGPDSPKSRNDAFALSVARASADAIVVTGKLLRDEPDLRYELDSLGLPREPLEDYRRRLGLPQPPNLYVLTSGRGLDPEHSALRGWARATLWTSADANLDGLEALPTVRRTNPSLRALVRELRSSGAARVLIEAGPSTSATLYDAPGLVDEVLLSVFCGSEPEHLAGALPQAALDLDPVAAPAERDEASGTWAFQMRRRPGTLDPTTST